MEAVVLEEYTRKDVTVEVKCFAEGEGGVEARACMQVQVVCRNREMMKSQVH